MPQTIIDLGQKVKAKYPGTYDNLDDAEVGRRVQAKYPQYSQFMDVPKDAPPTSVIPQELQKQPDGKDLLEKLENGIHDGSFPGPMMVVNGIKQLAGSVPAFANNAKARGAADVLEGVGKVASPLGIVGAAMAPATGALAVGGGMLGQKLASLAANKLGASPDTERLVGDLGGIAGGMSGAQIAPTNPLTALQNVGGALKGGAKGAAQGATETLKLGPTGLKISPLEAIKGAYKGGKAGVTDLTTKRLIQQSRENPRIPAWMLNQPSSPEAQAAANPAPAPVAIPDILPSGRKVGGIQNQPIAPPEPQPKISVINGKAYLHDEKGRFHAGAAMPAPNGSTDRVVIVGGKPYLNINGHLFDPKVLKK